MRLESRRKRKEVYDNNLFETRETCNEPAILILLENGREYIKKK